MNTIIPGARSRAGSSKLLDSGFALARIPDDV
jgi:hypothetical protein